MLYILRTSGKRGKRQRIGGGCSSWMKGEGMVCLITDMLHSFSVCFHVYALCWLENMTADFLFYLCVTPLGELFTDRSECLAQRFASPLLSSTLPFKSFTPQLALPSLFFIYLFFKPLRNNRLGTSTVSVQGDTESLAFSWQIIKKRKADQTGPKVAVAI